MMPQSGFFLQQIIKVDGHVGTVEGADAQMHDPRRYGTAIIVGNRYVFAKRGKVQGIQ